MSWLYALFLGLIQGITEFFPVSSSAHLKFFKILLGIPSNEETVLFDLFCHLGTLLALSVYFRQDIADLLFRNQRRLIPLAVGLLPLIPFYFLLKPMRDTLSQPGYLGYCMLGTAILLFCAARLRRQEKTEWKVKDALWIGTLQGAALIPGVSRSAATITGALWRGMAIQEAVRFSFLLSLPAVSGGTFLELLKVKSHLSSFAISLPVCMIGFAAAATAGSLVVRFAIPLLQRGVLRPFAWYCLFAGILLTLYL